MFATNVLASLSAPAACGAWNFFMQENDSVMLNFVMVFCEAIFLRVIAERETLANKTKLTSKKRVKDEGNHLDVCRMAMHITCREW